MALRLRRIGKHWLQTLKSGGGVQAGLHQRNEWETLVDGEALDFGVLEAEADRACRKPCAKNCSRYSQRIFPVPAA